MPKTRQSKQKGTATGELALIERIRQRASQPKAPRSALRLGIGDDCAILQPRLGEEVLVTTDFSLEGRHFRRDWHSPQSIGHRVLARGLSDLASMGAKPLAAFLSLALPRSVAKKQAWLNGFLDGLLGLAAQHSVPLAGGDTSESPSDHVLTDIVLLGTAPRGKSLRRSGARPGDLLYVTGTLGGASTELAQLPSVRLRRAASSDKHPHLFPQPRLAVGQALLHRELATACIDTSDGLSTDLAHLCKASKVRAEIETGALPLHSLTASVQPEAALNAALHGGEDYELLFTVAPSKGLLEHLAKIPVTCIGRILSPRSSQPTITLRTGKRRESLQPQGWEHLK